MRALGADELHASQTQPAFAENKKLCPGGRPPFFYDRFFKTTDQRREVGNEMPNVSRRRERAVALFRQEPTKHTPRQNCARLVPAYT